MYPEKSMMEKHKTYNSQFIKLNLNVGYQKKKRKRKACLDNFENCLCISVCVI